MSRNSSLINDSYVCPHCKDSLNIKHNEIICIGCAEKFNINGNVPEFFPGDNYWGIYNAETINKLNQDAESIGWMDALIKNIDKSTVDYMLNETRSDLSHFIPLDKRTTVLDLGSSWGSLSTNISKHCNKLFAIDICYETIKFLEIRARQMGLKNISVSRSDALTMPFPDGMFDVVILNGVLEWFGFRGRFVADQNYLFRKGAEGLRNDEKNPRALQLRALMEVSRVLKKDGVCITAIENRISKVYFQGSPDDHTGVWGVNLLPRSLANLVMKYKKGESYSTYTYTKKGYERLFKEAGFQFSNFLCAFPSYETPKEIIPYNSKIIEYRYKSLFYKYNRLSIHDFSLKVFLIGSLKKFFKQLIKIPLKGIVFTFFPSFMCPSFIIISGKRNSTIDK